MTVPLPHAFDALLDALEHIPALRPWRELLPEQIAQGLSPARWGDLPQWQAVLDALPRWQASKLDLVDSVTLGQPVNADGVAASVDLPLLRDTLMGLHPWRKGPYHLFGLHLDTEWRSDWKWDRVLPHLADLKDRLVLDVGCGNGYHCWRMLGAGARRVIGIDPSPRFVYQFQAIKHFTGAQPVDVLPLGIEALPGKLQAFDTVFSMGVFYHRRSPMDHLRELKECLRPGGQLVLETLLIEGADGEVLVPEGRYAKMPNVWFLPSAATLLGWMRKCGLRNPRLVDENVTSLDEQRRTDWMTFESLRDFLDPDDLSRTAEGHPAPRRGVFVAEA